MKLFSQIVCRRTISLVVFLVAPVLMAQAQEAKNLDNPQPAQSSVLQNVNPKVTSSLPARAQRKDLPFQTGNGEQAGTLELGNQDAHHLFEFDRLSVVPQSPRSAQATNSSYVFPTEDERLKRYLWHTFGPLSLLGMGVAAGLDQHRNSPPEWRQGASGYGKRYASRFGQYAIEQTVTYGLSEAFRLDTGFVKSNLTGFGPRLGDALLQNITSRTRSGKRIISVPRLAGAYVGGIIPAVTWYPSRFSYKDGLRQGTYSLAAGFGVNVLREFIFR